MITLHTPDRFLFSNGDLSEISLQQHGSEMPDSYHRVVELRKIISFCSSGSTLVDFEGRIAKLKEPDPRNRSLLERTLEVFEGWWFQINWEPLPVSLEEDNCRCTLCGLETVALNDGMPIFTEQMFLERLATAIANEEELDFSKKECSRAETNRIADQFFKKQSQIPNEAILVLESKIKALTGKKVSIEFDDDWLESIKHKDWRDHQKRIHFRIKLEQKKPPPKLETHLFQSMKLFGGKELSKWFPKAKSPNLKSGNMSPVVTTLEKHYTMNSLI